MTEFRVWSIARSDWEIERDRHVRKLGPEPGLAGCWSLSGSSDNVLVEAPAFDEICLPSLNFSDKSSGGHNGLCLRAPAYRVVDHDVWNHTFPCYAHLCLSQISHPLC